MREKRVNLLNLYKHVLLNKDEYVSMYDIKSVEEDLLVLNSRILMKRGGGGMYFCKMSTHGTVRTNHLKVYDKNKVTQEIIIRWSLTEEQYREVLSMPSNKFYLINNRQTYNSTDFIVTFSGPSSSVSLLTNRGLNNVYDFNT